MTKMFILTSVLGLVQGSLALAATPPATATMTPTKVPAIYNNVYVPMGFDSNDNVQITATGIFENGCYRPAENTVAVDASQKRIEIGPAAYKYNGLCMQVVLPFQRVIDVGVLEPGQYSIFQKGEPKALGTLNVQAATVETPDDFPYAPVSQAYVDDNAQGVTELTIKGEMPNDCMKISDVKISAQSQVIVVQPIVSVDARPNCGTTPVPFKQVTPIANVPKGRYLLHVRSMNANAINNLVDVP